MEDHGGDFIWIFFWIEFHCQFHCAIDLPKGLEVKAQGFVDPNVQSGAKHTSATTSQGLGPSGPCRKWQATPYTGCFHGVPLQRCNNLWPAPPQQVDFEQSNLHGQWKRNEISRRRISESSSYQRVVQCSFTCYPLGISHSYWTLPFIIDLPIKHIVY